MTRTTRKTGAKLTPDQKLEYVKLMVEEHYTNQQIIDLSAADPTVLSRAKKPFLAEQQGEVVVGKTPLNAAKRRIQKLKKQLADSKMDVVLLKKATAFFIRDNPALKCIGR
jgi:transposase